MRRNTAGARALIESRELPEYRYSGSQGIGVDEILDSAPKPKTKRKPTASVVAKVMAKATEEVAQFQAAERYGELRGKHFAALYAELHTHVYGAPCLELGVGDAWFGAASAAERMLKTEFRENGRAMIEFMRWVWNRERRVEKRRRADGQGGGRRITWRLQFVQRHLLTDFHVEMSRAGKR